MPISASTPTPVPTPASVYLDLFCVYTTFASVYLDLFCIYTYTHVYLICDCVYHFCL